MADSYNKRVDLHRYGVTTGGVVTGMLSTTGIGGSPGRSVQNPSYTVTYVYRIPGAATNPTRWGREALTFRQGQPLRIGSPVIVRYDPKNPPNSMLQLGGNWDERAFLIFMTFYASIYIAMLGAACLVLTRLIDRFM